MPVLKRSRNFSQVFSSHYASRELKEKRKTINLQILTTPFVLACYTLYIFFNEDIQNENQAKLEEYGSIYAVSVCSAALGLLTYFEDLIICF